MAPAPQRRVAVRKTVRIGRPGYRVTKQFDPEAGSRGLLFQVGGWALAGGRVAASCGCWLAVVRCPRAPVPPACLPPACCNLIQPAPSPLLPSLSPPPPQIEYPEIEEGARPRHRVMSSYEQRKEPWSKEWQYLLFAAEPYVSGRRSARLAACLLGRRGPPQLPTRALVEMGRCTP